MDIKKIEALPVKKSETKEYLKKEITRQELNFSDLISNKAIAKLINLENMNDFERKNLFTAEIILGRTVERVTDVKDKTLYIKCTSRDGKNVTYYYNDGFGNKVEFNDDDNDGKMDKIRIIKDNMTIIGIDKDDDGKFDTSAGFLHDSEAVLGDKGIYKLIFNPKKASHHSLFKFFSK